MKKKPLLIIVAAVLVLGLGGGVYALSDKEPVQNTEQSNQIETVKPHGVFQATPKAEEQPVAEPQPTVTEEPVSQPEPAPAPSPAPAPEQPQPQPAPEQPKEEPRQGFWPAAGPDGDL